MTTFIQPLQRKDGRWDMTSRTNSTAPRAIGYCAGWREYTDDEFAEMASRLGAGLVEGIRRDVEERRPRKDKYHDDGHATEEEASSCYDSHLLDTHLTFRRSDDEQHKCRVCGAWAQTRAEIRADAEFARHWLCDAHANRRAYEPVFRGRHDRSPR